MRMGKPDPVVVKRAHHNPCRASDKSSTSERMGKTKVCSCIDHHTVGGVHWYVPDAGVAVPVVLTTVPVIA